MARKAKPNDALAIEQEEVLTQQLADEVESRIVTQDAHDDYYDSRQMIPADNVDADGVPWATVGENIRKGHNGVISKQIAIEMLSALLGTQIEIETVNVVVTKSTPLTIDNTKFKVTNASIYSVEKSIIGFFCKSDVTNGFSNIYFALQPTGNYIQVRQNINSDINCTIMIWCILG